MLIFTGTPDQISWKQKIHNVLLQNELGSASPYVLSYARRGKSGYSFGYAQWDLSARPATQAILRDILQNAINASGQYIIQDSDSTSGRSNDTLIQTLMDLAVQPGGTSLTPEQRSLIDQALSSTYGQNTIDQRHDQHLGEVLALVDTVISSVGDSQDQVFLQTDVPKLFLADYHNQFNIDLPPKIAPLYDFLRGQPASIGGGRVQKVGRLGMADLLNFYFSTKYAVETTDGLNDELRRFNNIIQITGGVYQLPEDQTAREEEAKGLVRVYQDFLESKQSQLNALGNNFSHLNSTVIEPARVVLIGQYVNDAGIAISINGDVIVGEDQASLARNTKHATDADLLTGSDQSDLILGESGNDTIQGNLGDDVLYGGTGVDIYKYRPGDGNDVILDSDGRGVIRYGADGQEQNLVLGIRDTNDPTGQYHGLDGGILYQWNGSGSDLTITLPNQQRITVKDYNPGDLHLALIDKPADPSGPVLTGTDAHNADLTDTGTPAGLAGGGVLDRNWQGYQPLGQSNYPTSRPTAPYFGWFRKVCILVSALATPVVMADEPVMPDFQSLPQKYEYRHEISRVGSPSPDIVVDELLIGDVTAKELKFYFYLIGTNGHICGGSGIAIFYDDSYYYSAPSVREVYEQGKFKKEKTECRLRIQFDSNKASLLDEAGNCKQILCGTRAYIGDAHFKRAR